MKTHHEVRVGDDDEGGARLRERASTHDRVFASWELNIPQGPTIKGGDFFDAPYPMTQEGLDDIKEAAARRATQIVKPMLQQQGQIGVPDLPAQFVTILCVVPAAPHVRN